MCDKRVGKSVGGGVAGNFNDADVARLFESRCLASCFHGDAAISGLVPEVE